MGPSSTFRWMHFAILLKEMIQLISCNVSCRSQKLFGARQSFLSSGAKPYCVCDIKTMQKLQSATHSLEYLFVICFSFDCLICFQAKKYLAIKWVFSAQWLTAENLYNLYFMKFIFISYLVNKEMCLQILKCIHDLVLDISDIQ